MATSSTSYQKGEGWLGQSVEAAKRTGWKVLTLAAAGAIALAGCAPQANGNSTPKPTSVETQAPSVSQTCAEYAAELKANQPQPGSPEWNAYVAELRIPYVEGQPNADVLTGYVQASIDAISSGVQDLPADLATLQDCREQVRTITGNSTDLAVNGQALVDLLGIKWRVDAANQALIDPNGELGPEATAERVVNFNVHTFMTLEIQAINEVTGLTPEFTINQDTMALGETPAGYVEGRINVTRMALGASDDFNIGAKLNAVDGSWIAVGQAKN